MTGDVIEILETMQHQLSIKSLFEKFQFDTSTCLIVSYSYIRSVNVFGLPNFSAQCSYRNSENNKSSSQLRNFKKKWSTAPKINEL